MWYAAKVQSIMRDGKQITVNVGDPIPEAEEWVNRDMWRRQKFIYEGPEPEAKAPKKRAKKVKPAELITEFEPAEERPRFRIED